MKFSGSERGAEPNGEPDPGPDADGVGVRSRGAPLLGEHTREVLADYGFTAEEVDGLLDSGVAMEDGA